jgi:membrane protein implicated in regulation of membrane protease activity
MEWLTALYAEQPFWIWLAVAAIILTVEVITGSGWLLWAAASAAAVAYLAMLWPDLGPPGEIAAFAVLTMVSTFASRRFLGRRKADDPHDLNDPARLIGRTGQTTSPFQNGYGRVAVEGAEWAAELEGGGALPEGTRVEVAALADGARLVVRQT